MHLSLPFPSHTPPVISKGKVDKGKQAKLVKSGKERGKFRN